MAGRRCLRGRRGRASSFTVIGSTPAPTRDKCFTPDADSHCRTNRLAGYEVFVLLACMRRSL
jgi:hypothetical protein